MTDERLHQVLDSYERYLTDDPLADIDRHHEHLLTMIPKMRGFMEEGRREKVMRWLGFMQGVFWTTGAFTLDELKRHNMPPDMEYSGT